MRPPALTFSIQWIVPFAPQGIELGFDLRANGPIGTVDSSLAIHRQVHRFDESNEVL